MPDVTVYFDIETGGLELTHPIIQLAAIAVSDDDGDELSEFEAKLLFDVSTADPEALEINHYDKDVWMSEAIAPLKACSDFAAWLQAFLSIEMTSKRTGRKYEVARLAGYNSANFDAPRLQELFKKWGVFLPAHPMTLDVMQAALWAAHWNGWPTTPIKLEDACRFHGVPLEGAHDALSDVRATAALAWRLRS